MTGQIPEWGLMAPMVVITPLMVGIVMEAVVAAGRADTRVLVESKHSGSTCVQTSGLNWAGSSSQTT